VGPFSEHDFTQFSEYAGFLKRARHDEKERHGQHALVGKTRERLIDRVTPPIVRSISTENTTRSVSAIRG